MGSSYILQGAYKFLLSLVTIIFFKNKATLHLFCKQAASHEGSNFLKTKKYSYEKDLIDVRGICYAAFRLRICFNHSA